MKLQQENIITENTSSFKYFNLKKPKLEPYWHFHPEIELTYIHQGQGSRFVGDHIGSFYSGDLVLLGENLPHHWVSDPKASYSIQEAFVIQFSRSIFQEFSEFQAVFQLLEEAKHGIYFNQPHPTLIKKLIELSDYDPFKRMITLYEIVDFMIHDQKREILSSISYHPKDQHEGLNSKFTAVSSFIINHLHQSIDLNTISEIADMTPPAFCRWFKKSTGKSFVNYLNSVRIEKACQLLLLTDKNISEIAYETGFESLSNFNRTFRKMKGVAPRKYRLSEKSL